MVGHAELLTPRFVAKGKAKSLDFSKMIGTTIPIERKVTDPFLEKRQWPELDAFAQAAIDNNQEIVTNHTINNVQRSVGARLGGWIAERFGNYEVTPGQSQLALKRMKLPQVCCSLRIEVLLDKALGLLPPRASS